MLFTEGKNRFYEALMQKPPYEQRSGAGKRNSNNFRYSFADLDCNYCTEKKICPDICLCPYVLDTLPDLLMDTAFLQMALNAESNETKHKQTLIYLQNQFICKGVC